MKSCCLFFFLLLPLFFIYSNYSFICSGTFYLCLFSVSSHSLSLLLLLRILALLCVRVSPCLSVARSLLPARVHGALGSPRCQYHPELRHKGLSLLLLRPPLLGPLVSLPPSVNPTPAHPIHPRLQPRVTHPKLC